MMATRMVRGGGGIDSAMANMVTAKVVVVGINAGWKGVMIVEDGW
jgi:hypothetical protein